MSSVAPPPAVHLMEASRAGQHERVHDLLRSLRFPPEIEESYRDRASAKTLPPLTSGEVVLAREVASLVKRRRRLQGLLAFARFRSLYQPSSDGDGVLANERASPGDVLKRMNALFDALGFARWTLQSDGWKNFKRLLRLENDRSRRWPYRPKTAGRIARQQLVDRAQGILSRKK